MTTVTDLTNTLDENELTLLSKGPKFVINRTINDDMKWEIRTNFCRLAYQLRWKAQFTRIKDNDEILMKYPRSDFISQLPSLNSELETKLKICYARIKHILETNSNVHSNLNKAEKSTLNTLKKKPFIFLPSDKGGEFCVVEKSHNDELVIAHLSDTNTYKKVKRMSAKTIEDKINNSWREITKQGNINQSTIQSYISNNTKISNFY